MKALCALFVTALMLALSGVSLGAAAEDSLGIVSHIRRAPVDSRAIAAIGYSKRLHALEIEFVNGAIYRYADVPQNVYEQLLEADSKARFYDQNVRGRYSSVHVRPRKTDSPRP